MGRSQEGGVEMISVFEGNLEIGTISEWIRGDVTLYQGMVPQDDGQILSNTFTTEEQAERYIREKYAILGYVPFCKRLETAVKISNLSYRVLGYELGTSASAVQKWVSGENYPAVHFLWRLSQVLFTKEQGEKVFLEWVKTINRER